MGSLLLDLHEIKIPNVSLERIVGQGANGVVALGRNPFIEREVAVKVWLKLRSNDRRDKFQQGLFEARKAASASGNATLTIFDAGEVGTNFYMVMEYFPGITLRSWFREHPSLHARWCIVSLVLEALDSFHKRGVFHGDLHADNILIRHSESNTIGETAHWVSDGFVQLKIIDFGTSHFAGPRFSMARHWRVLGETIDEALSPLKMRILWGHRHPLTDDAFEMNTWFRTYVDSVCDMLGLAITHRSEIRAFRFVGESRIILTRAGHRSIVELINHGEISKEDIETFRRIGRSTSRQLDGVR